jgi:tRNA 5-methylaminomethyl-2-thiouridine biosynthesis bifunctional protein
MALDWKDGQPYSERFGDVYFSSDSGLHETRHVFLRGNRLAERFAALQPGASFCIAETGFGTGLNFLCAWQLFEQLAPPGASLDFFSIEKYPLADDELCAALALWPELHELAEALCARWQRRVPGWNRWNFGRVRLTLALEDVAQALPQLPPATVDAWFLDGFAPSRNPEMWAEPVLAAVARAARPGATLATYTSAGWVRRSLQQAGFEVVRVPGYGRKREMLQGGLPGSQIPGRAPATALVIGGGLAGCAAARALAERGVAVTLLEQAAQLADAASGNPRGILHARFGAGMNALHRFVLAAYGHALGLLDELLPADGHRRATCGLLQLACNEAEQQRIARLAQLEWPPHLLQFVDAQQASRLAGIEMAYGGMWFPAGGWVVPPQLCARLADHPQITLRLGGAVTALEKTAAGWRAHGDNFACEAQQVIVCGSYQARALGQFAQFPLQPVRGQISMLPATPESTRLHAVVCGEGYCAPAVDGRHVAGATTGFDDEAVDVRAADHVSNLEQLAAGMPALRAALGAVDVAHLAGRAGVRCSVPGAMPLVGEVEPGLYCSLAHGTRGLLTAGLAGEVVAAAICGQLPPLPQQVLAALSPQRLRKH